MLVLSLASQLFLTSVSFERDFMAISLGFVAASCLDLGSLPGHFRFALGWKRFNLHGQCEASRCSQASGMASRSIQSGGRLIHCGVLSDMVSDMNITLKGEYLRVTVSMALQAGGGGVLSSLTATTFTSFYSSECMQAQTTKLGHRCQPSKLLKWDRSAENWSPPKSR